MYENISFQSKQYNIKSFFLILETKPTCELCCYDARGNNNLLRQKSIHEVTNQLESNGYIFCST